VEYIFLERECIAAIVSEFLKLVPHDVRESRLLADLGCLVQFESTYLMKEAIQVLYSSQD
jgi:hypothetical protein